MAANYSPDELPSKGNETSLSTDIITNGSNSQHVGVKSVHKAGKTLKTKKRKWPEGKPKRPLNAYNYFFQHEREKIIKATLSSTTENSESASSNHTRHKTSGVGFAGLARKVASKWKTLDKSEKAAFETKAALDKRRYLDEVSVWERNQKQGQSLSIPTPLFATGSQAVNEMFAFLAYSQALLMVCQRQKDMLVQQVLNSSYNSVQTPSGNYQPGNLDCAVLSGNTKQADGVHIGNKSLDRNDSSRSHHTNYCCMDAPMNYTISEGESVSLCDSLQDTRAPTSIQGTDLCLPSEDEHMDIFNVFEEE